MSIARIAQKILDLRKPEKRLERSLFNKQLEILNDKSPFKAACCTRRAGKSHVACSALLLCAFATPNIDVLYLGLTIGSSKRIMMPKFREVNRMLGSILTINESDSLIKLPNGSRIWLVGADNKHLIDTLLGNKWGRVVIDEAQSFGSHLIELIDDVLVPALLDLQGDLWLLGTPGPLPQGLFYDAIHDINSSYAVHKWSLLDNIYLPHAVEWLEALKKRRQWTDDTPSYARQYLNKWVYDPDSLVYKYSSKCACNALPSGIVWTYVLGLDYGWHDKTAFAIMAYNDRCPIAYVVKSWAIGELIPSAIAEIVVKLDQQYKFEAIVCDTGGLGKSITEEFRKRYGLPVKAAVKTDKMAFIASFNGELQQGNIQVIVQDNEELIKQWMALQYDDRMKEDPALQNDLCLDKNSLIYTSNGTKAICKVNPGDLVLTRNGFKRCLRSWSTGNKSHVVIRTKCGKELLATHNHLIFTERGFVRADALLYSDKLEGLSWNRKSLTGLFLEGIQSLSFVLCAPIFIASCLLVRSIKWLRCIVMSGNFSMVRLSAMFMYITKTAILRITKSRISKQLRKVFITKNTKKTKRERSKQKKQLNTCHLLENSQKSGTQAKKAMSGMYSMVRMFLQSNTKIKSKLFVQSVIKNMKGLKRHTERNLFAQIAVTLKKGECQARIISRKFAHFVEKNLKLTNTQEKKCVLQIASIKHNARKINVWDLEVEDSHEFYANGILVHNCDAVLYVSRYIYHYLYTKPEPKLVAGTNEWNDEQERQMIENATNNLQRSESWI